MWCALTILRHPRVIRVRPETLNWLDSVWNADRTSGDALALQDFNNVVVTDVGGDMAEVQDGVHLKLSAAWLSSSWVSPETYQVWVRTRQDLAVGGDGRGRRKMRRCAGEESQSSGWAVEGVHGWVMSERRTRMRKGRWREGEGVTPGGLSEAVAHAMVEWGKRGWLHVATAHREGRGVREGRADGIREGTRLLLIGGGHDVGRRRRKSQWRTRLVRIDGERGVGGPLIRLCRARRVRRRGGGEQGRQMSNARRCRHGGRGPRRKEVSLSCQHKPERVRKGRGRRMEGTRDRHAALCSEQERTRRGTHRAVVTHTHSAGRAGFGWPVARKWESGGGGLGREREPEGAVDGCSFKDDDGRGRERGGDDVDGGKV